MTASALVDCQWLRENLTATGQVILDATFFLPRQQRDAFAEYRRAHIPGALFFDIDEIADHSNPLPHTLPNNRQFADAVGKLGIDNNTRVIVYDNNRFFAAARAWWMFRVFGHDRVRVLNGGLNRWLLQLSYPTESIVPEPKTKNFTAHYRPYLVYDLTQMKRTQHVREKQMLDARSEDSFLGRRPLADSNLQSGHIPGSINIPYAGLTDDKRHTLLSTPQLAELMQQKDVDLSRPIVVTCGSGVSAAVLALALYDFGKDAVPVYDGSWAEWGRQTDTPKQTAE